ncbi:UN13C protein, partial [Oreotrochilus melanogaster]|nr:UN13C protein [Oreotrochilus melanogaster]
HDSKGVSEVCVGEVELNWDGYVKIPCSVRQNKKDLHGNSSDGTMQTSSESVGRVSEGQDLSSLSISMNWREVAERQGCFPQEKPFAYKSRRRQSRDRSADVVDYIVKELQGISRIQTEIAELRQHLTLIKGSVDEVSSCVDTVLSEIEGLQSGSTGKTQGTHAREPSREVEVHKEEPVLYFYGIPEEDGENTVELVCSFLSEHHCFNGIQCSKYIKDAYRSDVGTCKSLTPRPAVVTFVSCEQRDFILQKSVLLQSSGVQIVTSEEQMLQSHQRGSKTESVSSQSGLKKNNLNTVNPESAQTTDAVGRLRTDSCQVKYKSRKAQCLGERADPVQKSTSTKKSNLLPETGKEAQTISFSEQPSDDSHINQALHEPLQNLQVANLAKSSDGNYCCSPDSLDCASQIRASSNGSEHKLDTESVTENGSSLLDKDEGITTESIVTDCGSSCKFTSVEKVDVQREDVSSGLTTTSYDHTTDDMAYSSDSLKDMIQMDLNDQDPTDQVFRDV